MDFKQLVVNNLEGNKLNIFNIAGEKVAYLELITVEDISNFEVIEKITNWRNKFKSCFLSEFVPTVDRTKAWLESSIIYSKNRVFFKIYNIENHFVGHIGAIRKLNHIEYDNYLIGGRVGFRHSALIIAQIFLLWLYEIDDIDYLSARVRSDNVHALKVHQKTGFNIYSKKPLRKIEVSNSEITYEISDSESDSEISLIEIRAMSTDIVLKN